MSEQHFKLYEPFTTLFLLPDEIKERYKTLKDLLNDHQLLKGQFSLKTPKTALGVKTELKRMRMAWRPQLELAKGLYTSKRLSEYFADNFLRNYITSLSSKRKGRPLSSLSKRRLISKMFAFLAKNLILHDTQFALSHIDNCVGSAIKRQKEDLESLLGKRGLDFDQFFDPKKYPIFQSKKVKFESIAQASLPLKTSRSSLKGVNKSQNTMVNTTSKGTEIEFPLIYNSTEASGTAQFNRNQPVMKDVGTTNVCEMIDFGNEIQSINLPENHSLSGLDSVKSVQIGPDSQIGDNSYDSPNKSFEGKEAIPGEDKAERRGRDAQEDGSEVREQESLHFSDISSVYCEMGIQTSELSFPVTPLNRGADRNQATMTVMNGNFDDSISLEDKFTQVNF